MNEKKYQLATTLLAAALLVGSSAGVATAQVAPSRIRIAETESRHVPAIQLDRGPRARSFVQPSVIASAPAQLIVESAPVSFGDVLADRNAELVDALIVRVFSNSDWELRLVPESAVAIAARVESPAMSRLEWKNPASVRWIGFRSGESVVVGRGKQTGPAGELVSIDLRLRLSDRDPIGQYGFNLRLAVETNH
jgi:hypothetical protein